MKRNIPLSVQIWLFCVGVTLSIFLLIALVLPYSLRNFFTEQVFDILMGSEPTINCAVSVVATSASPMPVQPSIQIKNEEDKASIGPIETDGPIETKSLMITLPTNENGNNNTGTLFISSTESGNNNGEGIFSAVIPTIATAITPASLPIVNYLIINEDISATGPYELPEGFYQGIRDDAQEQIAQVAKYSKEINKRTLYYVIRKNQINGQAASLVSYTWGSYSDDLAQQMLGRLTWLMLVAILGSLLPSILLARRLTQPLVQMENHMTQIAEGNLQQPITLKRRDEIGRLAQSFEQMRCRLLRQDEAQRSYHQNISHELKTPVMIIRSYSQSILDGVYPNGTLEGSLAVINKETDRLDKRIGDLIYLSKLNYLTTREHEWALFYLDQELRDCLERFKCQRVDIQFETQVNSLRIRGDREQWRVVLENILDNQIRYARQVIKICLKKQEGIGILSIANDGPLIDEGQLSSLFEPFAIGNKGQYGLGLAIVRQVVNLHQGTIKIENHKTGPCFLIELPYAAE
ncbi:MAG: sensor histidine kinase [Firmicutes bacterium HGW-Firmicutes-15]|nr:MAG: sensor histidine kinase [Firmicutes bacterium HGW-Firmicutes-15]